MNFNKLWDRCAPSKYKYADVGRILRPGRDAFLERAWRNHASRV